MNHREEEFFMAKKSVYAAIEIADQEVRLVVLEVFDARNNILRVERVLHHGLKDGRITDEKNVVEAIQKACAQAQKALGYKIESVLLAIPANKISQSNQVVHVAIEDGTHKVRQFHLQQGLKTATENGGKEGQELVNINRIVYSIDGVQQPKTVLGADTPDFDMEIDLLYTDRDLVYSYVRAVEQAGLKVMDICLDAYAQGKETAALELSCEKPVILLGLEKDHTMLSVMMNGRLMSTMSLPSGYGDFSKELQEKYSLSDATAWRLLENLFSSDSEDYRDVIVYIEQQENQRVELTDRDLAEAILPHVRKWIAEINAACQPIVSSRPCRFMITGQGSDIPVLKTMESAFSAPASVYSVTDIGARSGAFATGLGLAFAWEDANKIRHSDKISVNKNELEASIESISRYGKDEEGGFTKKLKRVMLTNQG